MPNYAGRSYETDQALRMQQTKQKSVMTKSSFDFVETILVLSASAERLRPLPNYLS